jgi:hypothetical protein
MAEKKIKKKKKKKICSFCPYVCKPFFDMLIQTLLAFQRGAAGVLSKFCRLAAIDSGNRIKILSVPIVAAACLSVLLPSFAFISHSCCCVILQ